jgi:hypothetical protein
MALVIEDARFLATRGAESNKLHGLISVLWTADWQGSRWVGIIVAGGDPSSPAPRAHVQESDITMHRVCFRMRRRAKDVRA